MGKVVQIHSGDQTIKLNIMNYCALNIAQETWFIGDTKAELIEAVYTWKLDEYRRLVAKVPGYKERIYHSYSEEFTTEEANRDIVDFLFRALPDYHYQTFVNTSYAWQYK
jgi:hypothetical protein